MNTDGILQSENLRFHPHQKLHISVYGLNSSTMEGGQRACWGLMARSLALGCVRDCISKAGCVRAGHHLPQASVFINTGLDTTQSHVTHMHKCIFI